MTDQTGIGFGRVSGEAADSDTAITFRCMDPGDLLTVDEVAEWLRVTPAWVRAHANGNRAPKLPSLKLGAHRRFRRQAVEAFLRMLSNAA